MDTAPCIEYGEGEVITAAIAVGALGGPVEGAALVVGADRHVVRRLEKAGQPVSRDQWSAWRPLRTWH